MSDERNRELWLHAHEVCDGDRDAMWEYVADALRMACAELAARRVWERQWEVFAATLEQADVDDVVQEFLEKSTGFGSEEAT